MGFTRPVCDIPPDVSFAHPSVIRNDGCVTDIISRFFVSRISEERDLGIVEIFE